MLILFVNTRYVTDDQPIDPYVSIDADEHHLDKSSTKPKTFDPVWNESFTHEVHNVSRYVYQLAHNSVVPQISTYRAIFDIFKCCSLGITVFHDAAIPPDDFVANCTIPFEDLMHREKDATDFWVSFSIIRYIFVYLTKIFQDLAYLINNL